MSPRTAEQFEMIRQGRREEILDAALHVFAESGYHSASVSQIAKRACVSKGLMYNYFESKEEVLTTLITDLFEYTMERMKIYPNEVIDDARFEEIIEISVQIPIEEPQRWKLYMGLAFQKDVTEMIMQEMMGRMGPYVEGLGQYFKKQGHQDPMAMMRIFSAVLDGVQMHCLLDPVNFPVENAKRYLKEQFVRR
ncbi:MAG: TetR/AcrR family transcriptional regulator [Cryomorphaceae bacterium]